MADQQSIGDVYRFFSDNRANELTLVQFSREWKELSPESKEQIRTGITNGTLTY